MRPLALIAGFLLTAAGCSSEEKLYDVSGTVTFAGRPVPKGSITFGPDGFKGTTGPQGSADIVDGRFDTKLGGTGVRGGWYTVRVSGFDSKAGPDAPFGTSLFPEHTEGKELPAAPSTLDVAVPGGKK